MMNKKGLVYFLLGILLTTVVFFGIKFFYDSNKNEVTSDYIILQNQINHLNKMVVVEQDFSSLQKNTVAYKVLGKTISDNKIITLTKTNAQVSYNLNEMEIMVDSINKKLIITRLPQAEIKITPSVEIESLDDSFFNRIGEQQIKEVSESAKRNAIKGVNQKDLTRRGQKQLLENLNHIFILAKTLNYTIVDETTKLNFDQL